MLLLEAVIFFSLWACEFSLSFSLKEGQNFLIVTSLHVICSWRFIDLIIIIIIFAAVGLGQLKLEQPEISISRAKDKSAHISCKVSSNTFSTDYIHWYRQKPDQGIEHLIYIDSTISANRKNNKFEASKDLHASPSTLKINFLEKQDEAVYFCACWTVAHNVRVAKMPAQESPSVCAHTHPSQRGRPQRLQSWAPRRSLPPHRT